MDTRKSFLRYDDEQTSQDIIMNRSKPSLHGRFLNIKIIFHTQEMCITECLLKNRNYIMYIHVEADLSFYHLHIITTEFSWPQNCVCSSFFSLNTLFMTVQWLY